MSSRSSPRNARLATAGVAAGVGLLHLALFMVLGHLRPITPPTPLSRPVEVELVRPSPIPPLPAPPPSKPAPVAGGGAPAAPSRTHLPARKPERPPELTAPPKAAPEAPLVIGVAPEAGATPGQGLGGIGTGSGSGAGAGSGPGAGDGPPRLILGPTKDQLRRLHPREAFRQRLNGSARIACRIRLDTRLEDCRVVDEAPSGRGFGEAALAASGYFRFRPPTRDGRPVEGREITVGVEFMP
ncbi:TonB family protein [Brevundimonas sp. NPDC090276]|uniref:TonB family protein n=1 Tax=Brevundimonas sp. NPDC090276 TaxID=3363956 RepID=UPI00383A1CC6